MTHRTHLRVSEDLEKALLRSRIPPTPGLWRAGKSGMVLVASIFLLLFLPKISLAASIYLSPASGSYSVGSTITVSIKVDSQGAAVNTAEASITYSSDTLDLVSQRQGSTFYLASPGSPSRSYFGGGQPSPGYTGSGGSLGVLTFRAKAVGTATVSVGSGKVLLNDGFGTNVFSGSGGARFTITPPPVGGPQVSSTTHASQDAWYTATTLTVSWTRPNGATGFSFELDQNATSSPDDTLDTTITTTKTYDGLKEGIYYFHIKARGSSGFGPTTNFKVQIDTTAPKAFEIKLANETDPAKISNPPTISFETTDELSGIDRYEVLFDGKSVQDKATSPYTLVQAKPGKHVIAVVAFDKAGNKQTASLEVGIVQAAGIGFFSLTICIPAYLLWLLILIIILLLIGILLLWFKKKHNDFPAEFQIVREDIDNSLDELKQKISQKLANLSGKSYQDLYQKEAEAEKAIRTGIAKTRKKIDSKIGRLDRKK